MMSRSGSPAGMLKSDCKSGWWCIRHSSGATVDEAFENDAADQVRESPVFLCAFCESPFQLSPEDSLSIRYSGRTPEVECPACKAQRESGG